MSSASQQTSRCTGTPQVGRLSCKGYLRPVGLVVIYWSEEDSAFVVDVPELPGCMADGQTYQEAVTNVEIVIQAWIETAKELGRAIPAPKGRLMFA